MAGPGAVVVGGGVGGLAAALELARRGYDVTLLERHPELGGKASQRAEAGFRWDEGPSLVVMPWVYTTLFESAGLDPAAYLPMRRLDPAFRVILTDGRPLDIPAGEEALRDAFAAIEPADADGLTRFLAKLDRFAALIGHAYCDRMLESWPQVMLSPLMASAAILAPTTPYTDEVDRTFRSPVLRELLYGFPTFSGFDPKRAPASLALIPWTILREGVWYPENGGVAAIPRAIAAACRDKGVTIRTGVEVEAIELDARGQVAGVATSAGPIATRVVVSNSDYVHTHRMLRGGKGFSAEVEDLRAGRAQPSQSFLTVQLGCDRTWAGMAHHMLVLTPGSGRVFEELFERGEFTSDPPIYANVTSVTDPADAPAGGSNPFIVVGAPPLRPGGEPVPEFEDAYAERLVEKLEAAGLPGLRASVVSRHVAGPGHWRDRFSGFLGSIYGLGTKHNVLGGGFRPVNYRADVPGLYFAGGGVQPGAGLPMVVQSGKIVAARIAKDFPTARPAAAVPVGARP